MVECLPDIAKSLIPFQQWWEGCGYLPAHSWCSTAGEGRPALTWARLERHLGLSGESPVFSSVAWHRLGRGGRGAAHSVETITAQTEGQSPLPSALRSSQPLRNPFQGSSPQACQWDSRTELPRLCLLKTQSCLQP